MGTRWMRNADTGALYEAPESAVSLLAQSNWQELDQSEVDRLVEERDQAAAAAERSMQEAAASAAEQRAAEEAAAASAAERALQEKTAAPARPAGQDGPETPDDDAGARQNKKESA